VFNGKWYRTGDVGKLIYSSGKNSKYKVCGRVFSAVPFGENKVLFPGNLEAVFESSSKIQQIFLYVSEEKTFSGIILPSTFCAEEPEEYFRTELLCMAKEFQLEDFEVPSRLLIERSILWEQNNGFLSPQFKKLYQKFVHHYQSFLKQ
jgi:long-subunit acyl-CoA synthetase (AMP-forming)